MVRTQIQLTEEQAREIKKTAAARHLSMAELIRQGIDLIIKSNIPADMDERRKRAIDAAGRFGSGARDVSKHHDEYLASAFRK